MLTINQLKKKKRIRVNKLTKNELIQKTPQQKGICNKILTMSPKKPNSAIRKIAKIKLKNNKYLLAYIPGETHFLQEHNFVLIKGGKVQDLPGIKYKIIRGALDCIGVLNRKTSRSKYGTKKIN